ncbi:MAG: valine--tRNA ligase, partial [Acidiferrobacteraceae bacterium]|nr:valine--tRNA ligase [Acidiferrobacteraceae bacterium]
MIEIELDKGYTPHEIEKKLYRQWEADGLFLPSGVGNPYCIVIPPPNVTGSLHMGHAFQDTIMDALIRYHRMRGENVLWQPGTDHAGIATQMVVERQLESEGLTRHDFTRDNFIERVWQWKKQSGGTITSQLRRMGASADWTRERFTMDEDLSEAVQDVFIQLYQEGLIYRGKRLVNWDPVLHTALSDLEVISEEEAGHLWHLRYPLVDSSDYLVVATTRPETMLGDVAIAVHPDDDRYKNYIGQSAHLPLADRIIPVIMDDYVDPDFGSGCVKITPAHDFNDYEVGQRHHLEIINVLDENASIRLPGSPYHGLDRYEARRKMLEDLEELELIEQIDEHRFMVPRGDRSQSVVEPYLTDQWFVQMAPLAKPAIRAVESGQIKFVPANWSRTYYEWMNNIEDWCISRQIWWGHRIPAWYDKFGNIFVAKDENGAQEQARQKHGHTVDLQQDQDVLDTWFSSALWPFSTLGWPKKTSEMKTFYPTSTLVTGFDIIFFWVARMIMFGLKFAGSVPFKDVYVHGLVRDGDGQKMSKSKGNVLDPLDLIDGIKLDELIHKRTSGLMQPKMAQKITNDTKRHFPNGIPSYGTDALRFTFASMATHGRDIRFDLGRIEGYRNFCNKLWNATRFVLINTDDMPNTYDHELGTIEKWITSRFQSVAQEVDESFTHYRFDQVAQSIYAFIWNELCSWYLEIAKIELADPLISGKKRVGIQLTLLNMLDGSLRILHPLMPYITEALWQNIAPRIVQRPSSSIMTQAYPTGDHALIDNIAVLEVSWLQQLVSSLRTIRGTMNIDTNRKIPVLLQNIHQKE